VAKTAETITLTEEILTAVREKWSSENVEA